MYKAVVNTHSTTEALATPRVFVALLLFFLCLTRPSLFGQDYNYIGGLGLIATTFGFLLTCPAKRLLVSNSAPQLNTAVALLIFWCYAFGLTIFFGQSNLPYLFKAASAGFSVPLCLLLLSANGRIVEPTCAAFARLNALIGYSIGVTYCLMPLVGYAKLRLFTYAISGYDDGGEGGNGDVLFPFSFVYGNLIEYGIYRYSGMYREAGIAQAFFVWAFTYLAYSRARWWWMLGAMLGALLCGATAVIFSLAAVAVLHFGSRAREKPRELLILIALLGTLVLLLFFLPGLGLMDKAVTHSTSLTDRQDAMAMALPGADTWRWLFGHGLFYESAKPLENVGINAISSIFHIGVVGFLLYLATFFAGAFGTRSFTDSVRYLTLLSPFLVTSLFFQPMIDAPLIMTMLFFVAPAVRKSPASAD